MLLLLALVAPVGGYLDFLTVGHHNLCGSEYPMTCLLGPHGHASLVVYLEVELLDHMINIYSFLVDNGEYF